MDVSTVRHNCDQAIVPVSRGQRLLRRWIALSLPLLGGALIGCGSDTTGPAAVGAAQAYWALRLNVHAVNLDTTLPDRTIQLTAVPVTATGTPLVGLGAVTYTPEDTTVTVSATGLMTARYPTSGTFVVASLQAQGVTLADTVDIQVASTPPATALATFSIQPVPGDSAKRALDVRHLQWPVRATDAVGDSVCNSSGCALQLFYASSDSDIVSVDRRSGALTFNDTGHVTLTATTLAYGTVWRDSVRFTIGYPLYATVDVVPDSTGQRPVLAFSIDQSSPHMIGVGGTVTWRNNQDICVNSTNCHHVAGLDSIDVVFDDSTAVQPGLVCLTVGANCLPPTGVGGNIAPFGFDDAKYQAATSGGDANPFFFSVVQARSFPRAGTYTYHSRLYGTAGAVIVR